MNARQPARRRTTTATRTRRRTVPWRDQMDQIEAAVTLSCAVNDAYLLEAEIEMRKMNTDLDTLADSWSPDNPPMAPWDAEESIIAHSMMVDQFTEWQQSKQIASQ